MGRRVAGGADEALPATEFDAIAKEGTGRLPTTAPIPGNDVGRVAFNPYSGRPEEVFLSNRLTADELAKVYGHEIGHVIDQLAGEIPTKGLSVELKALYNTLNNPNRAGAEAASWGRPFTPEASGYKTDVPREFMAEAIRAYMADPNYIKTVAPKTAAAIRAAVNANPAVSRIVQFNMSGSSLPLALTLAHQARKPQSFAYLAGRDEADVLPLYYGAKKVGTVDLPSDARDDDVASTVAGAWDAGFDAIVFKKPAPNGGKAETFVLVRSRSQIGSPQAAFDSGKKDSADVLAANGVPAVLPSLGSLLLNERRHAEEARTSKWRGA